MLKDKMGKCQVGHIILCTQNVGQQLCYYYLDKYTMVSYQLYISRELMERARLEGKKIMDAQRSGKDHVQWNVTDVK